VGEYVKTRNLLWHFLVGIVLVWFPQLAFSQSADQFDHPIVNGERALRFRVNTGSLRPELLDVTVFYSDSRNRLNNLEDLTLSRGKPVLKLDPLLVNVLAAEFVFPHLDYPDDPNRSLYLRYKATGAELVIYENVEGQLSSLPGFGDWGSFFEGWPLDSPDAASPLDTNPVVYQRGTCVFYRIRISRGSEVIYTSPIHSFRMPDTYNIAIAGDSYGAGEGAPQDDFELLGNNDDMWSHDDCHRSRKSGLVRAVKRFIQRNPDVAVDYIHVACTGARVSNLISDEQTRAVMDFSEPHPVQFDIIQDEFLGDENQFHNELNLLLLSIGGNNAGFGSYVADFIIFPANAADDEDLPDEIEDNLDDLSDRFEGLDEDIQERFPTAKVAISTYPDSTKGPRGRCGRAPGPVEFAATYHCCLPEVDPVFNPVEEYRFTSNDFIKPLNDVIRDAADNANEPDAWTDWYVIDVEEEMGAHGFCDCDKPYINRGNMSIATQGDIFAIAHPNKKGYSEIYPELGSNTIADAYEDFVIERKGAILIAILLDIESPAIPEPCLRLVSLNPIFQLLDSLELSYPRHELLRNFVIDNGIKEALRTRDLDKIRQTAAYKKLLTEKVEAQKVYDQAFPKPLGKKSKPSKEKQPDREIKALNKLRDYIRSRQFQDMRAKVLSSAGRFKAPDDDDRLDRFFNRPVVKKVEPKKK
jgi:hypothetical protein